MRYVLVGAGQQMSTEGLVRFRPVLTQQPYRSESGQRAILNRSTMHKPVEERRNFGTLIPVMENLLLLLAAKG